MKNLVYNWAYTTYWTLSRWIEAYDIKSCCSAEFYSMVDRKGIVKCYVTKARLSIIELNKIKI